MLTIRCGSRGSVIPSATQLDSRSAQQWSNELTSIKMKTLIFVAFILCTASVGKLSSLFKVEILSKGNSKKKVFVVECIHKTPKHPTRAYATFLVAY